MRHAICYVSNSNRDLNSDQIKELLAFCEKKNKEMDIKGVLLFSEGNFFQILEGEKDKVLLLFDKIKADNRHHGLIQVVGRDIGHGSYDDYKVDIITEEAKYQQKIPNEYLEALKGIPSKVKEPMKRMLAMFLSTR